ncbi:MAG: cytochrome c-554 [Phenylobacterium sp.]|nr:cytochrome c-554 [Phenylobacterium sp.]
MRARLALTLMFVSFAGAALAGGDSMRDVMARDVNPGALAFWAGGNDPPDNETPAQARLRWAAALKGAQVLQARGRILMAAPYTRTGRWNADAKLMIDMGAAGEAAARAKDAPEAFEIGGRLYDACAGCHQTYVPKRG